MLETFATIIDALPAWIAPVIGAIVLLTWGLLDFHDPVCRHTRAVGWCPWCWCVKREHAE